MDKIKLEKYDLLINQFKKNINKSDMNIASIIDSIHLTLLRLYGYAIEQNRIIFSAFKKIKGYGELGSILSEVLQLIFVYTGGSISKFEMALKRARKISASKGNDYGNGFFYDNIFSQGNTGIVTRSTDKITRQKTLIVEQVQQQVVEEDILTTILDLLNYSVYAIMLIKGEWMTEENVLKYFDFLRSKGLGYMIAMYE